MNLPPPGVPASTGPGRSSRLKRRDAMPTKVRGEGKWRKRAANSPRITSKSSQERFHAGLFLLNEGQIKQRPANTRTTAPMRVSQGVKVFIFGSSVLLG